MALSQSNTRVDFTGYIPQFLVGINSTSPTFASDNVLNLPIATGAVLGKRFYLNEAQANSNSTLTQVCHAGWYRIVQVALGATAANIFFGAVGATQTNANGVDVVTSYDQAFVTGVDPVVFLGPVTPGNYTVVQDQGDATVRASGAVTAGDVVTAVKAGNGSVTDLGATAITGANFASIVGVATATIGAAGLVRVRFQAPFGE